MINEVSFVTPLHTATKRDYYARMNAKKPECMRVAKQYGHDYWDGDRKYGYGGYKYDGRWEKIGKAIKEYYSIEDGNQILDIGCGKGHLLQSFDFCTRFGIDISAHAIKNVNLRHYLHLINGYADDLSVYIDKQFDFTYSINVFHNLNYRDLKLAIREMMRVSKDKRYICVESYRTEEELCNLQCWALTCQSFYTPDDWKCILEDNGYSGDVEFIYFT